MPRKKKGSPVSSELRALARAIDNRAAKSPCMSVALPIVRLCCDHLCLLARVHELNAKEAINYQTPADARHDNFMAKVRT